LRHAIAESKVLGDAPGFFYESFNQKAFEDLAGVGLDFVHGDHRRSGKDVLSGLHF
jgi:dTDP-4-dehydrorhamnose 3,5-epimerase